MIKTKKGHKTMMDKCKCSTVNNNNDNVRANKQYKVPRNPVSSPNPGKMNRKKMKKYVLRH